MQVIPYAEPLRKPLYTRDTTILFACGVVLIVLGGMVGFVGISSSLAAIVKANTQRSNVASAATALLVAIIASAGMILTGIGSMRLRRWSRVVVVCVCGNLLALGLVTLLVMAFMYVTAPPIMPTLQQAGGARLRASRPPATNDGFIIFMWGALIVTSLALLLAFFLVYRSRRIALALEDADRTATWTDGRPLPAIALAMMLAAFALAIMFALFHLPPIPIGYASADTAEARVVLGGVMIIFAVFFAWSAWLIFRLHPLGAWLALLLIGLSAGGAVAAMTNDALRDSFGPTNYRYSPFEITWNLQLASVRGVLVVGAYAIPAALFVLRVRRMLDDMNTSERERPPT